MLKEGPAVEVTGEEKGVRGAWFKTYIHNQYLNLTDDFVGVFKGSRGVFIAKYFHVSSIRPLPPPPAADQSYDLADVVDAFVGNGWWKGFVSKVHVFEGKTKYSVVLFEKPPEYTKQRFSSKKLRFHWVWTDDAKWVRPPYIKSPNQQQGPLPETRAAESSKKRPRELNNHINDQEVLAADKTNDNSTEVISEGNFYQSSNVQAESEIARNGDIPFRKSLYLWKQIESLEVFRILPQKPHFSPLKDCIEETREGTAIGHMLTFASLVEKVSKLQVEDPNSLFERYLETLCILEGVGFDVKAIVDRISELLPLKTKQEQMDSQSKRYHSEIVESNAKKAKLIEELNDIDKKMMELEEQRAKIVSQMAKEDERRNSLQRSNSAIEDDLLCVKEKFKVKAGAPWYC